MMTNELLPGEDILELENVNGNICVTVVVPTHRLSPERRADKITLKRAVDQAIDLIRYNHDGELILRSLSSSLKELESAADLLHNYDGLGLYVSPGIKKIVRFPFQVSGKVMVGERFDLRDLWYKIQLAATYYTLMVTEKKVKFWEGHLDELEEISNPDIPSAFYEEYLYDVPSRSSSYSGYAHVKSFERDKTVVEEHRMKSFLKKIHEEIRKYIIGDQRLILIAPEKTISWYKEIIGASPKITNTITGNYAYSSNAEIEKMVWPIILEDIQNNFKKEIEQANELSGRHRAVFGLEACWRAAADGNAFKLLVEKDYRCFGFTAKNGRQLYLKPPPFTHVSLPDVVDELIYLVKSKNGKIIFGENDSLINQGRIALITRY
jgi:hypothetical protein